MRQAVLIFAGLLLVGAATVAPAAGEEPALLPKAAKFEKGAGTFTITARTHVNAGAGVESEARYLTDLLAGALGGKMAVDQGAAAEGGISLALDPQLARLGTEGYAMSVGREGIRIRAATAAGVFYGCQTLRELLPAAIEKKEKMGDGALAAPCCTIEDQPRYPWRGILLDTSRHFFPKAFILREIDLLALHKMNVFHWHLTDDQGWRIEIKKYPRLTEVGAWRKATTTDSDWAGGMIRGGQYGGFYTQEEVREVVAYAASRHVTVVPEIEMPGHSQAALAAYPNLSCTGGPFAVATDWGVHRDVYCAGKEQTFQFLQDVLDEVCELFPGSYIHIGGDECPKDRWLACADCKKRMADEGLKSGQELQSYFIKRMGAYLASKNRKLIGWNEILQGGLGSNAAVMSWQGTSGGRTAALQGHDVVMTPESNCYFDHLAEWTSGRAYASVPLNRAYAFAPTPADLPAALAGHILGSQGNVWGERIATGERADFMTFPRACALAEDLWTTGPQNYNEFAGRLVRHFARLEALAVKYYDDPLAHAVEVGQWKADQMSHTNVELEWDLTRYIKAPGPLTVRFEYLDGRDMLRIHWVELQRNGEAVTRDTHEVQAGGATRANNFQFDLPQWADGAKYSLRALVQSPSGTDSHGQVFLIRQERTAAPR